MRILHCCLAAFYIDNFSYQENILPRLHKQAGHDVMILASTETYTQNKKLGYVEASSYVTRDDIPIKRIPYKPGLPNFLKRKLRIYQNVISSIEQFNPDIIFMHDGQTYASVEIARYVKRHPNVKVIMDSHTDYINSANGWVSKNILHKIIYRYFIKQITPHVEKLYGTLPIRMTFYKEMYNFPENKIAFLPFGFDTSLVDFSQRQKIRLQIRQKLNIGEKDFVLITGGKIDRRKNIHVLLEAMQHLNGDKVKLILFGTPVQDMKEDIEKLISKNPNVKYIGWIQSTDSYKYFFASDLVIFPGTHSTLWEETIGLGLPGIFKRWQGIEHIDLGGNIMLMDEISAETLTSTIMGIATNTQLYNQMYNIATQEENMKMFDYVDIAKRAIKLS